MPLTLLSRISWFKFYAEIFYFQGTEWWFEQRILRSERRWLGAPVLCGLQASLQKRIFRSLWEEGRKLRAKCLFLFLLNLNAQGVLKKNKKMRRMSLLVISWLSVKGRGWGCFGKNIGTEAFLRFYENIRAFLYPAQCMQNTLCQHKSGKRIKHKILESKLKSSLNDPMS